MCTALFHPVQTIRFAIALVLFNIPYFSTTALADTDPWKESYRLESVYQYDAALVAISNISSDNELALLRRGWLNYLKGSHSKSIEFYQKAISKNSNSLDARLGIILPLLEQQRWREAAQNAKKVLEQAPWNYYAHIRLMQTEQGLKQWNELATHAKALSERYPSDPSALVFLARAKHKLGDTSAAKEAYQKVLELIPDHFEAQQYLE